MALFKTRPYYRLTIQWPLVLGVLCAAPVWAEHQEAFEAYERSDYETAFKKGLPLAEQGNVDAQLMLGTMHEEGRGVPQNYGEAARWYRLAANKGNSLAQVNLGELYEYGQGVTKDFVQAYMWYSLAGAGGYRDGTKWRDRLSTLMTPIQIAEAERLAREWKPSSLPVP